jgi:hypothetical protein
MLKPKRFNLKIQSINFTRKAASHYLLKYFFVYTVKQSYLYFRFFTFIY